MTKTLISNPGLEKSQGEKIETTDVTSVDVPL